MLPSTRPVTSSPFSRSLALHLFVNHTVFSPFRLVRPRLPTGCQAPSLLDAHAPGRNARSGRRAYLGQLQLADFQGFEQRCSDGHQAQFEALGAEDRSKTIVEEKASFPRLRGKREAGISGWEFTFQLDHLYTDQATLTEKQKLIQWILNRKARNTQVHVHGDAVAEPSPAPNFDVITPPNSGIC
eukprot:6185304-Pleurochrysis_carterae.AAC.2